MFNSQHYKTVQNTDYKLTIAYTLCLYFVMLQSYYRVHCDTYNCIMNASHSHSIKNCQLLRIMAPVWVQHFTTFKPIYILTYTFRHIAP